MSKGRVCLLYQIRVTQKSVLLLSKHAQEGWKHKAERGFIDAGLGKQRRMLL
jgi:hypothetical protein